jgi:hypothetical protein
LQTNETLWLHHTGWWLLDMAALFVVGAVLAGCVRWRIRLNAAAQTLDRAHWNPQRNRLRRWCEKAWPQARRVLVAFGGEVGSPVVLCE